MEKENQIPIKKRMYNFVCPNCKHLYKGHLNLFGKICIHCGLEILPPDDFELPIIADNKKKDKAMREKARQSVIRRFKESQNGN